MACVRTAWLTLDGMSMPLENEAAGYFCGSLDLGWPVVREVVNDRPNADGTDDLTTLMGARAVTADITAIAGVGAVIDAVASGFGPFMVPSVRPVLHYVLDVPGAAERTLTLRASGYAWPIVGPFTRDVQLQWVAADPIAGRHRKNRHRVGRFIGCGWPGLSVGIRSLVSVGIGRLGGRTDSRRG